MTARVEWMGNPITPKEVTIDFVLHGATVDVFEKAVPLPERTVTILLQEGQSWAAATRRFYRRGQPVTLYINDATFEGRVKFRRLRKLVCVGRFRETPEYIGETPESLRGAAVKIEEAMG